MEGNTLVLPVPPLGHWSILIIEADAPTPAMDWTLTREETNLKPPSAADLGLAAVNVQNGQWKKTCEAENYNTQFQVAELVNDLDASGGAALHATPESAHWYMTTGTYVSPPLPGKYMATFRLRVADNTSDQPVVSLQMVHEGFQPELGAGLLVSKVLEIKGTDFAKPNIYQDFQVPFERGDSGYNGLACVYLGNADVWWDKAELEFLEPWTTADFEKYYEEFAPPADLKRTDNGQLDVLHVRGPWNRLYRVDEALVKVSGAPVKLTDAYTQIVAMQGIKINGFKFDWNSLYQQDLLILNNVETRQLGYGPYKMISKWVKDGGNLVILGGLYTLGQGYNMRTGWPELLPVEMPDMPYEIKKCATPARFGETAPALGLSSSAWAAPTVVIYRHMVRVKPGAEVLLSGTDNEPLLVRGQYGQGSVTAFTGTTLGTAPPGTTPFWKFTAWPTLLAAALKRR